MSPLSGGNTNTHNNEYPVSHDPSDRLMGIMGHEKVTSAVQSSHRLFLHGSKVSLPPPFIQIVVSLIVQLVFSDTNVQLGKFNNNT